MIQKYTPDEARSLKQYGELPETTKIAEMESGFGDEEGGDVEFQEASDEEDEDLDDL